MYSPIGPMRSHGRKVTRSGCCRMSVSMMWQLQQTGRHTDSASCRFLGAKESHSTVLPSASSSACRSSWVSGSDSGKTRNLHAWLRQLSQISEYTSSQIGLPRWSGQVLDGPCQQDMTDRYDKVREDMEFRKDVAKSVGVGFELPKTLNCSNVPKRSEEVVAVNA